MKFYIGGFTWSGESQFDRFIDDGLWENGYEEEKYSTLFSQIKVGDYFALKSTFVKGRKPNAKSYLRIKKIGLVSELIDTKSIKVKWINSFPEFELTDIKWYANTLEKITNKLDIYRIFGRVLNLTNMENYINILKNKKQIILQGAPGTGKTYISAEIAMSIINGEVKNYTNRKELMIDYKKAIKGGLINFTTFHQSMDYEEFIEGLKPTTTGDNITYKVEDGIFKKASINSYFEQIIFDDKEKKIDFYYFYELLVENYKQKNSLFLLTKDGKKIEIKNVSDRNNLHCYHENSNVRHTVGKERLKKLYEKYDDIKILDDLTGFHDIFEKIIGGANQTVYWAVLHELLKYKKELNIEIISEDILDYKTKKEMINNLEFNEIKYKESFKNHVLIIDEINRGNVSKIFGELITLLENDKRLNSENEITVTLPYSKEEFGVPSNLHIIATMNTADRSVGHIDYAVRRRFAFVTLQSEKDKIENFYNFNSLPQELSSQAVLLFDNTYKIMENISPDFSINDLMIGHSYFMAKSKDELQLKLNYEIKPLLIEYVKDGVLFMTNEEMIQITNLSL